MAIVVLSVLLLILIGFPFWYCTNKGESAVMVSGFSFRVPVLRYFKYSLMAVNASSAKNVVTASLVFTLRVLYMMIFAFGFSKKTLQFKAQMSLAPNPESFIVWISVFNLVLFGFASNAFSMCCLVARLTPMALPFG